VLADGALVARSDSEGAAHLATSYLPAALEIDCPGWRVRALEPLRRGKSGGEWTGIESYLVWLVRD